MIAWSGARIVAHGRRLAGLQVQHVRVEHGARRRRRPRPARPPRGTRTPRRDRCCAAAAASPRAAARGTPLRQPRIEHRDDPAIVSGRISRPAPCASTSAATGRSTATKASSALLGALRRAPRAAARRARGNGILSITTSTHDAPAASMPAQNDRVPTSTDVSSSTNSFVSRPKSRSPCASTSWSVRARSTSAKLRDVRRATCTARARARRPR